MKAVALMVLLALPCLADGWPIPKAAFYHASTNDQKAQRVGFWRSGGAYVMRVAGTGSMKPFVFGGEMVAFRAYRGEKLAPGTVIEWDRGDNPSVMHMVVEDKGASLYVTGINNRYSDGWVAKSKVRGVLLEVITGPK